MKGWIPARIRLADYPQLKQLAWQVQEITAAHAASAYRDDILFLGYLPEETAAELMASALALTYLSFFEGFGLRAVYLLTKNMLLCISD